MGKGVGDKGNVGRRDVRQAAPVGRPAVFSVSPFPGILWPSAKRIFHVLCLPTFPPLVSLWKRAKRFSRDQGRAQTPNGTGDPREWRPSQTNRIPVSIPLRRRRTTPTGVTLRANPVDVVTVTLAACCPSLHTPRVRLHPSCSTVILSGRTPASRTIHRSQCNDVIFTF